MTVPSGSSHDHDFIAARVKQNTVGASIAAAVLLYFAYSGGGFVLHDDTSAFGVGARVFVYTIRVGGFAMLVSAIWSWTGMLPALLFDGVFSTLIGLLMCAGAGLMMIGGGAGLLYLLVGGVFVHVGVRNGRAWGRISRGLSVGAEIPRAAATRSPGHPPEPERVAALPHESRREVPEVSTAVPESLEEPMPPPVVADPPPEGFLASFAPESEEDEDHA